MNSGNGVDRRYSDAIAKAWDDLTALEPADVAAKSGGSLEDGKIELDFFNKKAIVDLESKEIKLSDDSEIEDDWKVLLLHYILGAEGKLDGELASYREFEGGDLYYSVFHGRALMPLISMFGEDSEALARAGEALGGVRVNRGDVSLDFSVFPYLLVNITIWEGDDEVPASANILFDSAVGRAMPAEDLAHLCSDLVTQLKAGSK